MGARQDVPPFTRGATFANGDPQVSDTTNVTLYGVGGANLEGRTYVFEADADATLVAYSSLGSDATGRQVTCKIVRNKSGAALKPGRVVHYTESTSTSTAQDNIYETNVDGYCKVLADRPAGVVDDYLGAAGVADGDLFYIVIDGPTRVCAINSTQPSWTVGTRLVPAATGSTRTDDAAGRVAVQDVTGSAATLANNIQNQVGFAGSYQAGGSVSDVGAVLLPAVVHIPNSGR